MKIAIVDGEELYCLKIKNIIENKYPSIDIYTFYNGQSFLVNNEQYDINGYKEPYCYTTSEPQTYSLTFDVR